RSWPRANDSNSRGVSAVIAPLAEIHSRHDPPQPSAGPCRRKSKCIGSVRSALSADTGNSGTSAAEASAKAIARKRLILPPSIAAEPLFLRGYPRSRWALADQEPPYVSFLMQGTDSGLV